MKIIGELTFATIILIGLTILISFIFLIIFTIKALIKYVKSKDIKKEKSLIKKSLGEVLKQHRKECKMTIVLAKLFKISPEELLDEIQ